MQSRHRQAGLTLIELGIALTLGALLVIALIAVFIASNRAYQQNEAMAVLQDNARFALDLLSRDLAMAGYWGGVRATDAKVNVRVSAAAQAGISTANACGPATPPAGTINWLFNVGAPLEFRNHRASAAVNTFFGCLTTADLVADSDVLMIRHVAGAATFEDGRTPPGTTVANRFYVKTNQNIASLFRATGTDHGAARATPLDCPDDTGVNALCPPVDTPQQVYAYTPQLYYVRKHSPGRPRSAPILCRRYLVDTGSTAEMAEDCLAEGVETMQLEWGLGGSAVEQYSNEPTADQLLTARTVRIHLLVRSPGVRLQASNDAKTYTLADLRDFTPVDFTADDEDKDPNKRHLRRLFTTTVQLKNLQP